VTLSSLGATLAAPAYMCFYVKRRLDYKPDTTPDYILARKAEAAREEEREREKERARAKEFDDELLATVG
jgi:ubiquitin carboxyl-terminal hydrolase 22/27/51